MPSDPLLPATRETNGRSPARFAGQTRFWVMAVLAGLGIVVLGLFSFHRERVRLRHLMFRELEAVAELQSRQLSDWRQERLNDGSFLSNTGAIARDVATLLARPETEEARAALTGWFGTMKGGERYESVLLLDAAFKVRLSVPADANPPCSRLKERFDKVGASPLLSDLHQEPGEKGAHMEVVAPIFAPDVSLPAARERAAPIAYAVLRINAARHTDRLLAAWPNPSRTGETLLLRQEGNEIVFLSHLRHAPEGWGLRRSADHQELIAASVVRGDVHAREGVDYHGVPVLGAGRALPNSPWFVVAKIDQAEAYEAISRDAWRTAGLIFVGILAVGLGLAFVQRLREARLLARTLRAEQEQKRLAERLALLTRHASDLIVLADQDGRIVEANERAREVYGYTLEELRELTIVDLRAPESRASFPEQFEQLKAREQMIMETWQRRKNGDVFPVEINVRRVTWEGRPHFLAVVRDTTERRVLQEQAIQAQRMEAVGTMASGIAHDLNNILAPMLLVGGILEEQIKEPGTLRLLGMANASAKRGAEVVRQLLTYSRGQTGQRGRMFPQHLLKEMVLIMRETFPRSIEIVVNAPTSIVEVVADATQIHQVVLNLCINARDAMNNSGTLTLTARNVEARPGELAEGSAAGPYVAIEVQDSGHGIPPEHLPRIFEPFFTTKPVGKGTGLGLCTTAAIVKAHAGHIKVKSQVGQGTTFSIFLPAAGPIGTEKAPAPASTPERPVRSTRVLVVDDEEIVLRTTQAVLERHGYAVATARNGVDALRLYLELRPEVDLVITDLMMPVMGGVPFIRALRVIDPTQRVLAISGLFEASTEEELQLLGVGPILAKPVEMKTLLERVAAELAARK